MNYQKNYQELKNELLNIKNQIDKEVEEKGITKNLINYEPDLKNIYQKVIKACLNEQDEKYINFNYFSCRVVISLAKGYQYVALKEWLTGLKNFIEYTNQLSNLDKWIKSVSYFSSRLNCILQKRIEIFNTEKFDEIIATFRDVISAISTNNISTKIQESQQFKGNIYRGTLKEKKCYY